jgi:hypothetical protein
MAIGVRVEVDAGGKTISRYVSGGDSFCSQSSSTLHFGLGDATHIDAIRVFWSPDRIDVVGETPVNGFLEIVEGSTSVSSEASFGTTSIFEGVAPYPNPTRDAFVLKGDAPRTYIGVQVFDLLGREILSIPEWGGSIDQEISLSGNPAGTYFVRVQSDDTFVVHPIVLLSP